MIEGLGWMREVTAISLVVNTVHAFVVVIVAYCVRACSEMLTFPIMGRLHLFIERFQLKIKLRITMRANAIEAFNHVTVAWRRNILITLGCHSFL